MFKFDKMLMGLVAASVVLSVAVAAVTAWIGITLMSPDGAATESPPATRVGAAAPRRMSPADAPELNAALRGALAGLPRLRGPRLDPGALAGKVVLVAFFASWCGPCREELRHLKSVHAVYGGQGVEVVAVNLFEDFDDLSNDRRLEAYLDRLDPGFPVVKGDQSISRAFGHVRRIPTLYLFDREGRGISRFINARGGDTASLDFEALSGKIAPYL